MVKDFARGLGLNPEAILVKQAFSEPDTKYVDPQQRETIEIRSLIEAIKTELVSSPRRNSRHHKMLTGSGAAGRDRTCDQRVAAVPA